MLRVLLGVRFKVSATGRRLISLRFISVPPQFQFMRLVQGRSVSGGFGRGTGKGRQWRIARNKKARTGRASWVFRRLSGTGLDSYLVGRGNLNRFINILIYIDYFRLGFPLEYYLEYHARIYLNYRL